jgi:hypothetical protein
LEFNRHREISLVDPDARIEVLRIAGGTCSDPGWISVNYGLLAKNADRLHAMSWAGVIVDDFIKRQAAKHVEKERI